MSTTAFYPIGTPGTPWGPAEIQAWRARQRRHRSYFDEVQSQIERLRDRFSVSPYGSVSYAGESFTMFAVRNAWRDGRPLVLVTGGVHGYETSGVHGALRFLDHHAERYSDHFNLLVAPCVSPWAYERILRWNFNALDVNRNFRDNSPAEECAALMRLIAPYRGQILAHIDLHETTDSDETEFGPALAARDGKTHTPGIIPDGFYLVDDSENPRPEFQAYILERVARITHIAPADEKGEIIGSTVVAPGVIRYELSKLGLCASITGAKYTTTTEVYPDSPRATPDQCNDAQSETVCAALDYLLENS